MFRLKRTYLRHSIKYLAFYLRILELCSEIELAVHVKDHVTATQNSFAGSRVITMISMMSAPGRMVLAGGSAYFSTEVIGR